MGKYDRKFALRMFFGEIIRLSHTRDMLVEAISGGGYPLGKLVNNLVGNNTLIDKITNDYTGESHEFRLNEAGFKMYWRIDREFDVLKIRIGGDQADCYPLLAAKIRRLLNNGLIR